MPTHIPFYPQILSKSGDMDGFESLEQVEYWEPRICGALSLKMIIEGFYPQSSISLADLVREGMAIQAYGQNGWIHKSLLEIAQLHGLEGETNRQTTREEIKAYLDKGYMLIVSVSPRFTGGELDENDQIVPKGGHLIPLFDYILEGDHLSYILHHPSFETNFNWPSKTIRSEDFERSSSGNVIALKRSRNV